MEAMERHELVAWLGDGWSDEQTEQIWEQYQQFEREFPDADEDLAEAVLTAISQRADEVLDLDELGEADRQAQTAAHRTRLASKAAVLAYHAADQIGRGKAITETDLAAWLGVDRMTILSWRGKR